jgi:hypothetical protein
MSDLQRPPEEPSRPPLPLRVIGFFLLTASIYLVSCQAIFYI